MSFSVCIFCGSSFGDDPRYTEAARETGVEIARRGWTLVYGGARVGLMGVVANAALDAGGRVVGVVPRFLYEREVGHDGITSLEIVGSLTERKLRMGPRPISTEITCSQTIPFGKKSHALHHGKS